MVDFSLPTHFGSLFSPPRAEPRIIGVLSPAKHEAPEPGPPGAAPIKPKPPETPSVFFSKSWTLLFQGVALVIVYSFGLNMTSTAVFTRSSPAIANPRQRTFER